VGLLHKEEGFRVVTPKGPYGENLLGLQRLKGKSAMQKVVF
jgi:hypothetical protein